MSTENNNSFASCVYRAFREGSGKSDGYANFGTRYCYVGFQNSDRLNTGYVCRDGSFQQTYPARQKFYSLQAWKNAVIYENPTAFFLGEEEWHYEHVLKSGQWSPIYKQKLETKMQEYARRIAQRPTAEPPVAGPPLPAEPVQFAPTATHFVPASQVAYLVNAAFGNEYDGITYQQKICVTLNAASEVFRNYYRAYCIMIDDPDEHFLDRKLSPENLRKCLDDRNEYNVAFFDSLGLSIKETRIFL